MQTIISFLRSLCAGEGRRMMEINCFYENPNKRFFRIVYKV